MANRRGRDMVDPFAVRRPRSIWPPILVVLIVLLASCKDNKADPAATIEAGSTVEITPEATSEESTTSESTTAESQMPAAESTTQTATTVEPAFTTAKCQFNVLSGRDVECGYLIVPEKHAQPDNGRTLRLHVAIFKSDSPDPAPDPVVYLAGGPGAHALEAAQYEFGTTFAPMLADRDLVMFDQRGTGYSEPSLDSHELIGRFFHGFARHVNQPTGIALRTSFHTYGAIVSAGVGCCSLVSSPILRDSGNVAYWRPTVAVDLVRTGQTCQDKAVTNFVAQPVVYHYIPTIVSVY